MKYLIFLFIGTLVFSGCETRKDPILKNGYKAVRFYGDAHAIIKPNGRVLIMPNVVDAVDDDNYLVGLRQKAEPEFEVPGGIEAQPYGYFIYEKRTQKLHTGLSFDEYLRASNEIGINLNLSQNQ